MKEKILIVDDELDIVHLLRVLLETEGYEVNVAENGEEAMNQYHNNPPDVVLLDIMMPEIDGFEVCRQIRKHSSSDNYVPIIFLTAKGDQESKLKGFEEGGDDFLVKPVSSQEVIARVKSMLRLKQLHDQLREKNAELAEMAIRDGLTGLYNLRYFNKYLNEELERSKRYSRSLSCIGIDVDLFKRVNDLYGHPAGDCVLIGIAKHMLDRKRCNDVIFRPSGDEYIILAPETTAEEAYVYVERLRKELAEKEFIYDGKKVQVTISLGISSYPEQSIMDGEDLRKKSDKALYYSKINGRNRTSVYREDLIG